MTSHEVPARPGDRALYHAVRVALIIVLAIVTYVLFPSSPAVESPLFEVGAVATDNVIAPFAFRVRKAPAELQKERDELAATAKPIFVYSPAAQDSAVRAAEAIFRDISRAVEDGEPRTAAGRVRQAVARHGVTLTEPEAEYLAFRGRRLAMRDALERVLARKSSGHGVSIIEIGAGTGGTTASLLPLLPPERTVYAFTDVSRFFTDLGRKKFHDYPYLRYRELDVETDPGPQGYPAGSFDWAVAAHVLHATRNIAETLENILRLMAPGGLLLLLEETRFQRKYNFSMGFLPGFDHFEDYELRPLHPLLSSAQWREQLLRAGFTDFATFTEKGSAADVLGVDVMLARAPGGA